MIGLRGLVELLTAEEPLLPTMAFHEERCLRRFRQSRCEACSVACPMKAIQLARKPIVDVEKCADCGACSAACPTGALSLENVDWQRVLCGSGQGSQVSLACSRNTAGSSALPCLGCLGVGELMAATRHGERKVKLDTGACSSCNLGSMLQGLGRAVEQANSILDLFEGTQKIEYVGAHGHNSGQIRSPRLLSRRDLLGFFGGRWHAEDQDTKAEPFDMLNAVEAAGGSGGITPRRQLWLTQAIGWLVSARACKSASAVLPVGNIVIDDRCQLCLLCTSACPTRALTMDEDDHSYRIQFEAVRCLDCGLCAEICPCSSVSHLRGVTMSAYEHDRRWPLVHRMKAECSVCRGYFPLRPGQQTCDRCCKEADMETALLKPDTLAHV